MDSQSRSSMWRAEVWELCCRVAPVEGIQVVLCPFGSQHSSVKGASVNSLLCQLSEGLIKTGIMGLI